MISTENKIVREGDNLTLFCNVSGIPSPNVSWINAKNELMKVGATLQLPDINKSKRGKYKCITSNRCGNDSKTAFIDVQCESLFIRRSVIYKIFKIVHVLSLVDRCV